MALSHPETGANSDALAGAAPPGARIQSVQRAARLLMFIAEQPDGCTAKQAGDAFSLALPTTYHLLNTMVAEGLLAKDSHRRYSVGPKVGALSDAFLRDIHTAEWLMLPLRTLADETGETVSLAGWRRGEIRVLSTIEGDHALRVSGIRSGYSGHAHARATGKLLLAYTTPERRRDYLETHPREALTPKTITDIDALERECERIRKQGLAFDNEEFAQGVCCVAAPLLQNDVAVAAYSVLAPIERFKKSRTAFTKAVEQAAATAIAYAGQKQPAPAADG